MQTFSIIFSNHTAQVFAWQGTPSEVKKYLGNREVLGVVMAVDEESAVTVWRGSK